jgi:4-aminobutyrate--pyruvate transaminase
MNNIDNKKSSCNLPTSKEAQLDVDYHFHSQTNLRKHSQTPPLVITRGEGVYVFDENGNKYLEAMSGLWCASLGFSDDRLVRAATEQLSRLPFYHTFNHRTNDVVAKLAGEVARLVPLKNAKIFFASSGSEANDSMVKMAWNYHIARNEPKRRKILGRKKGFHGSTVMGASLSGLPHMHSAFGLPFDWTVHIECPHYYHNALEGETEEDYTQRLVRDLEDVIEREGADTIAAFIAEPIMGAGGVLVPPVGYFKSIQKVLKNHGILMLSDEIVCGFGRTGNWFGCETFNFTPDMMSCAKGLTGGYLPMSCVAVSGEVYAILEEYGAKNDVFGHGFTYSGHPTPAAVALEAIKIYREMNLPQTAKQLGRILHAELETLEKHPLVGEIRGKSVGFIAGIELVADKCNRVPFSIDEHIGAQVEVATRKRGLIVRNMGDVIALCPPFIVTEVEIKMIVRKLEAALNEVFANLKQPKH